MFWSGFVSSFRLYDSKIEYRATDYEKKITKARLKRKQRFVSLGSDYSCKQRRKIARFGKKKKKCKKDGIDERYGHSSRKKQKLPKASFT